MGKYASSVYRGIGCVFFLALGMVLSVSSARADDCEGIRQALRALPPEGGTVAIGPGLYLCSSPVILDRDHVTLRGVGNATLRLADSANAPLVVMGDVNTPPAPRVGIRVMDLRLDGNRENQQIECWGGPCDSGGTAFIRNNGITVRAITDGVIENVFIRGARSGGVVTEKGVYGLRIDGLTAVDNFFDGFAGYETYGAVLSRMDLSRNHAAGISLDIRFNGNTIRDTLISQNGDVGIFMRDSNANRFENLKIVGSGNHGLFLSQVEDPSTCTNDNEFRDLSVIGSRRSGFRLNSACHGNRLTGAAVFRENREGCISEGTNVPLEIQGSMICDQ